MAMAAAGNLLDRLDLTPVCKDLMGVVNFSYALCAAR
jgi:hypothetical protein